MSGEKTEQPSQKRLDDARKEGRIARSKTLAACIAGTCGFAALLSAAPSSGAELLAYTRQARVEAATGTTPLDVAATRALLAFANACAPLLGATLFGALLGAGLQVGVLFNTDAIALKFERLNPADGLKRVFSFRNLIEALKCALIVTVVLWLTWTALRDGTRLFVSLPRASAARALGLAFDAAGDLTLRALAAALALGAFDYLYQRHAHIKSLMMSKDDMKQEHKQSEGDPHNKAKRKSLHKSLLAGTAARGVQKASVVVLNPTHVAVALRYDPKETTAPPLVAKGTDEEAAKIRHLARHFRVPMVRDVPLARALVRFDVGDEIPEELYQAAAVVLQQVYEMGALPQAAPEQRSAR